MVSKISPRPTPPPAQPAPRLPSHPSSRPPIAKTEPLASFSETFKKRRSVIWSVGISVIVIAGVYIGAQYKESQQVRERLSDTLPGSAPIGVAQDITSVETGGATTRGMGHNQRQISFLEDRRGVLMKQKFDLERKIERVREKKKR